MTLQQKLKAKGFKYISTDKIYGQEVYSGVRVFHYDKDNEDHVEMLSRMYSIEYHEDFANPFGMNVNEYLIHPTLVSKAFHKLSSGTGAVISILFCDTG